MVAREGGEVTSGSTTASRPAPTTCLGASNITGEQGRTLDLGGGGGQEKGLGVRVQIPTLIHI